MSTITYKDGKMHVMLSGEIDHHNAQNIREEIDMAIHFNNPSELMLDFSDVSFMDSSGIGLVIGRYRIMHELEGKVLVANPSMQIRKVLRLSGIDRLAQID